MNLKESYIGRTHGDVYSVSLNEMFNMIDVDRDCFLSINDVTIEDNDWLNILKLNYVIDL